MAPVGVVQVIICKSETIVPGAQGPIPILVFGSVAAVKFYQFVSSDLFHFLLGKGIGSDRMVELDDVAVFFQKVYLELLL